MTLPMEMAIASGCTCTPLLFPVFSFLVPVPPLPLDRDQTVCPVSSCRSLCLHLFALLGIKLSLIGNYNPSAILVIML